MGKITGFMEFSRSLPILSDPKERIGNWNEFHAPFPSDELKKQGARCMGCGVPFCHAGSMVDGITAGCPLHNLIPEWNDLVYRGKWHEAYKLLSLTNNFPEFTGRVCPAPCESSCVLGINEEPVMIKEIEVSIIDRAFEKGWVVPRLPQFRSETRVAIIGSGPAGLACADELNQYGHNITVFERDDRIGGLLMYGIPNMKLDKNIVDRRVNLLTDEGIEFRTNVRAGKDISAYELKRDFDAIVLCCGAPKPRDLAIDGRQLQGIHFAMDFLTQATKQLLDSEVANVIDVKDKDVIVIGGGDTGTDCVGTTLRHGCKSLVQFEILPRPPDERAPDNPWPQWPKVYKLDYGQEEAKAIYGEDPREYLIHTKKFVGDEHGHVKELHTVRLEWVKDNGRFMPREIPGTERIFPAQLVLLAMGFLGPENPLLDQLGVAKDPRSNARAEHGKFVTNLPSVFTAGDMRRGQSLVVWAINEGRGAARECDRYLMGETALS